MSTNNPANQGSIIRTSRSRAQNRVTLGIATAIAIASWTKVVLAVAPGLPVTENFADQTLNDVAQTTADWNATGVGATSNLRLPSTSILVGTYSVGSLNTPLGGQTSSTRGLAIGDVNNDGLLDVVAVGSGRNQRYQNSGNANPFDGGGFDFTLDSNSTRSVTIADLNSDGFMDTVWANSGASSSNLIIYGPGSTEVILSTESTQSIRAADVDGDGDIDLLAGNLNKVDRYFENQGLGVFFTHNLAIPNSNDDTGAVALGDMDQDGLLDAIIATPSGQNWLYINNGTSDPFDSSSVVPTAISTDTNSLDGSDGIALGDLNGDGALDLVVGNAGVGTDHNRIYFNAATGPGTDPFSGVAGIDLSADAQVTTSIAIGDVDNDGDLDVAAGNIFGTTGPRPGTNRLYLNDGGGTFTTSVDISSAQNATRAIALADIDNDGQLDVITGNSGEVNRFYANAGTSGGGSVQQLNAFAASTELSTGQSVEFGRITTTTTSVGNALLNELDFWLSNDGGISWFKTIPDGRPVDLGSATTSLLWRTNLRSGSPTNAAAMALETLVLSAGNATPVAGSVASNGGGSAATQGLAYTSADLRTFFTDADGDPTYISISGLPVGTGLTINPQTGILSGVPTNADVLAALAATDSCPIPRLLLTATATDGVRSDSDGFRLRINNANDAPFVVSLIGPQTADLGGPFSLDVSTNFDDPDRVDPDLCGVNVPLTYAVSGLPVGTGITFDTITGVFGGSANATDFAAAQPISVTVTATDGGALSIPDTFSLTITDLANPPILATPIADQAGTENAIFGPVDISGSFSDADGDPLTFTNSGFPAGSGLGIDSAGVISGTPTNADSLASPFDVTVTATAVDGSVPDTFQFTITDVTNAPTLATPLSDQAGTEGTPFGPVDISGSFSDADGDALTFTDSGFPAGSGLSMDTAGVISGTPTNADSLASPFNLTVTATAVDGSVPDTYQFTITNLNDVPALDTPLSAQAGTEGTVFGPVDISGNFSDADGDPLTFSASGLPAGSGLSMSTAGVISGTPTDADAQASPITVTVTAIDGNGGGTPASFQLTVADIVIPPANQAPVVTSPGNQTATQGRAYSLDVSGNASDPDGDTLTFGATGLPAGTGLSISSGGIVSGTPTSADRLASPITVTVTVSDGNGGEGSAEFQLTVSAAPSTSGGGGGGGGGSSSLFTLFLLTMAGLSRRRRTRIQEV